MKPPRRKRARMAPALPPDITDMPIGGSFYTLDDVDRIIAATGLVLPTDPDEVLAPGEAGPVTRRIVMIDDMPTSLFVQEDTEPVRKKIDRRLGLHGRLNEAAIFWAADAVADQKNPKRPHSNEAWRMFVWVRLAGAFEVIFQTKPTANPIRKTIKGDDRFEDGRDHFEVNSPFTRFVKEATKPFDIEISGDAIREMRRNRRK